MASEPAVIVDRLVRTYHEGSTTERLALDHLSLQVEPGEIHGLLGPNGAGKTTLCKILSTVLLPTRGTAEVLGLDVVADAKRLRGELGIVFGGERGLYLRLTAEQNLRYWSALYRQPSREGRRRTRELLARVGLADRARERVETYSRGMKQRLHLARGLIGDPRLLVLDEPTTGMDPVAARDFRVFVRELRDEGRTVLMTTHDMAEAEAVCDRVSLIDRGRLLGTADPRTIGSWLTTYERIVARDVPARAVQALRDLSGVASVRTEGVDVTVETEEDGAAARVLRVLADAGVTTVRTARPDLEEVYLQVIGGRGMNTQ